MSLHFHPLRIKEIRKETPECVSVLFDIPKDLEETFAFKQGQSLTMRLFLDGEELRRTYSICSSPLDKEWRVAIKKQEAGLFSGFANEKLKAGDQLEVMQPVGKFYSDLHSTHKKNYLAFAAGSGITPVISIITTTLRTEPNSNFTLVFGNRNRSSIIFLEELENIKNKFPERFSLVHVLSRERTETNINAGHIDAEKLQQLSALIDYVSMDEIFICGPEAMIFCVKDFLGVKGIDPKKIHFELFTTAQQVIANRKIAPSNIPPLAGDKTSTITIKLDGRSFDFNMAMNSDIAILDAALKEGADLPYACKGGMCCTCKAKLQQGEVDMDVYWGLDHEEIEKGFILTCQSHPKSEKVVIDFDTRN